MIGARGGRLNEAESRLILSKIVSGLDDLHSTGIVHRDLKAANILIDFKTPISLGDKKVMTEDLLTFSDE